MRQIEKQLPHIFPDQIKEKEIFCITVAGYSDMNPKQYGKYKDKSSLRTEIH